MLIDIGRETTLPPHTAAGSRFPGISIWQRPGLRRSHHSAHLASTRYSAATEYVPGGNESIPCVQYDKAAALFKVPPGSDSQTVFTSAASRRARSSLSDRPFGPTMR